MTHDELIAYIDDSTDGLKHEHLFEKLLANTKALRAVVEYIHRDRTFSPDIPLTDYEQGLRDADRQIIAIIEKELK